MDYGVCQIGKRGASRTPVRNQVNHASVGGPPTWREKSSLVWLLPPGAPACEAECLHSFVDSGWAVARDRRRPGGRGTCLPLSPGRSLLQATEGRRNYGARGGYSGGPLLTAGGELVGINQRGYARGVFAAAVHARHVEALLYSLPD